MHLCSRAEFQRKNRRRPKFCHRIPIHFRRSLLVTPRQPGSRSRRGVSWSAMMSPLVSHLSGRGSGRRPTPPPPPPTPTHPNPSADVGIPWDKQPDLVEAQRSRLASRGRRSSPQKPYQCRYLRLYNVTASTAPAIATQVASLIELENANNLAIVTANQQLESHKHYQVSSWSLPPCRRHRIVIVHRRTALSQRGPLLNTPHHTSLPLPHYYHQTRKMIPKLIPELIP